MADRLDTYALARIDLAGAGTYGWQVRLQRRGVKYGKFFADGLHGGPEVSFEKASAWRDALLRSLDPVVGPVDQPMAAIEVLGSEMAGALASLFAVWDQDFDQSIQPFARSSTRRWMPRTSPSGIVHTPAMR